MSFFTEVRDNFLKSLIGIVWGELLTPKANKELDEKPDEQTEVNDDLVMTQMEAIWKARSDQLINDINNSKSLEERDKFIKQYEQEYMVYQDFIAFGFINDLNYPGAGQGIELGRVDLKNIRIDLLNEIFDKMQHLNELVSNTTEPDPSAKDISTTYFGDIPILLCDGEMTQKESNRVDEILSLNQEAAEYAEKLTKFKKGIEELAENNELYTNSWSENNLQKVWYSGYKGNIWDSMFNKDKSVGGGHYELSEEFAQAAGFFFPADVDAIKEGSDEYDALYNQDKIGHAMPEDFNKPKGREDFIAEFQNMCNMAREKTKQSWLEKDPVKSEKLLREAYVAWGKANHIVGDYRSHYMRGLNGTWRAHTEAIFFNKIEISPDNPYNDPWLFENAKQASRYFGSLVKSGVREFSNKMLERLFPTTINLDDFGELV